MKYTRLYIAYLLCGALSLSACMVTVINDSSQAILVINHNETNNKGQEAGTIIFIPKNSSRRFGRSDELANFTVYTKPPKNGHFYATYVVKQKHCGPNGNPVLKLSDIKNNTGNTHLFSITRNAAATYSSMVRQLPSMQRPDIFKEDGMKECTACQHR